MRMFTLMAVTAVIFLGLLAIDPAHAIRQTTPDRLPSDVLHDVAKGRLTIVGRPPEEIAETLAPLVREARTSGLSAEEEMALAQARFLTFDGAGARPLFARHQERDDRLGRVSRQSLLQMAFSQARYDDVRAGITSFRTKYRPSPADLEDTSRMVDNMARYLEAMGQDAQAVSLILEDVRRLPVDVPFAAFRLLATHMPALQRTGEGPGAVALMTQHRDALRARISAAGRTVPPAPLPRLTSVAHRAGVLHFDPFNDALLEDDPAMTPEGLLLDRTIIQIQFFDRGRGRGEAPRLARQSLSTFAGSISAARRAGR